MDEGSVRDLTHQSQEVRKRAGLAIEDGIETWLTTDAELAEVVQHFASYIKDETLTRALHVSSAIGAPGDGSTETIAASKLGDHEVVVTVRRA